jgi:hypothetical protein
MDPKSNINKQNFWCRNKYCQHLNILYGKQIFKETNGCILKECRTPASECRGAHNESSIKVLSSIYKFNFMKKNSIDWVKLYLEIIDSINNEKSKIHNLEHKDKTSNLIIYNFIELIQLWRNLSCYYRKIAKSLPNKSNSINSEIIDGYKYKEDLPTFYLSDLSEDIAWSFVRLTLVCPIQQKFDDHLKNNILVTIWDVCIATGLNCKEGIHKKNEMICNDNFLNGRCDCKTVELIKEEITIYEKQIENLKQSENDTLWTIQKSKKKSNTNKISLILSLEHKINDLKNSRLIHYTEEGFIPFVEQYKNYVEKQELELIILKEQEQKLKILEEEIKLKPIIKLSKFGKKN